MKRIEAETLEEAYEIACREYGCSFRRQGGCPGGLLSGGGVHPCG